jgi:hypothetical protein
MDQYTTPELNDQLYLHFKGEFSAGVGVACAVPTPSFFHRLYELICEACRSGAR